MDTRAGYGLEMPIECQYNNAYPSVYGLFLNAILTTHKNYTLINMIFV